MATEAALVASNPPDLFDPDIPLADFRSDTDDLPVDSFHDRHCEGSAARPHPAASSFSPLSSATSNGGCGVGRDKPGKGISGGSPAWNQKQEQLSPVPFSAGGHRSSGGGPSPSVPASWEVVTSETAEPIGSFGYGTMTGRAHAAGAGGEVQKITDCHTSRFALPVSIYLTRLCTEIVLLVVVLVSVKLITDVKHSVSAIRLCFASGYRYLNRKVVTVGLLGLLLSVPVIGALDLVFSNSLGMTRGGDNTMFNNFGQTQGRILLDINRDIEDKGSVGRNHIISVYIRKTTGIADGFGQQKHWSSHNSSEVPAELYVLMNGKHVKINCSLTADEKALAHWISHENSDQSGKDHEEATEQQNGTKSHLPVQNIFKTGVVFAIELAIIFVLFSVAGLLLGLLLCCTCWKTVQQNELLQDGTISQLELVEGLLCSASVYRYLNRVMTVRRLTLLLSALAFGALYLVFSNSLGMTRVSDNTMFNKFGQTHGKMVLGINHDIEDKVSVGNMISVDLRKTTDNADGLGQQKHWSSHNSSEVPAELYVLINGIHVKINCSLIANEKALAHWISHENDQSGKYHEEATEMQNGTKKSHLPVLKTGVDIAIASAISVVLCGGAGLLLWCTYWKRVEQNKLVQDGTISQLELFDGLLCFASVYRYLNRIVTVRCLALLLSGLVFGALYLVFSNSLGMRRGSDNMMFDNFDQTHSRILLDINHDIEDKGSVGKNDIINVDLRKTTGNADGFGQQKHWSSHNSSEVLAELYALMNEKHVKINCSLIADEKALAHWISYENGDQSGKDNKEATEMQNGNKKSHLPVQKKLKTWVVVAIASAILVMLCGVAGLLLWCTCWKRVQQNELVQDGSISQLELLEGIGPRQFRHHELAAATNNFANQNKLGEGGFGPVFRGRLRDRDVAIKMLSRDSRQGLNEFKAELKAMTQLRHRNIVQLVGWCNSNEGILLVYELMDEGCLDKHLYDPEKILTWQQRYKIALGLCSGLLYLHQGCDKCIVHGDIKPENIMLDASHNAKLGDFGTARLIEHGAEPQITEVIAGTLGFIDPVFIDNRLRCPEADVYSFGVTLLAIACGKRPARRQLLARVRDLYDQGIIIDAADGRLNGEFDQQQMVRVLVTGLWCAHQDPSQRPSIAQAMDVLRSADAKLPVLPATHNAEHIRSLEQQAYGDQPVEDPYAGAVSTTTYLTSNDSTYLLAEE